MVSYYREIFEMDIVSTADWRREKAEEYPDDERNERSADALVNLTEYVKGLDDNHPIFQAFEYFSDEDTDDDAIVSTTEIMSKALSRYGFDGKDDPEYFLCDLASRLRKEMRARLKIVSP